MIAIPRRLFLWIVVGLLGPAALLAAEPARPGGITDRTHPRLLFPAEREDEVRSRITSDELAAQMHREVMREAEETLDEPTCRYEIPDGRRLLGESRRALRTIVQAGMAWRLGGEEKFRRRVIAELEAAAALPDWNPRHFLDVAEMATAVAIGYDWLHPTLTADQRMRYEEALLTKALRPARAAYRNGAWWTDGRNNWAQVCGAGIALGAVAVWERDPELCGELLREGVALVERCGRFYAPDGVYPEGPGYWHYGTNYHVLLLAAGESLGVDIEVEPTLEKSGTFILEAAGPSGLYFNFADMGQSRARVSPAQLWIARHFANVRQAARLRDQLREDPSAGGRLAALSLLWLPAPADPGEVAVQNPWVVDGDQPMAFLRSGRGPEAAWLAIKGGTGAVSHGHLDAGSFVYEAGGVRWFVDLGSDDYNLPGYFGDRRWEYFRLNNRSHNTLVIGDQLQEAPDDPCQIRDSGREDGTAWVEIDLGPAYAGQAASVVRRAGLAEAGGAVRIVDTIDQPAGAVRWAVATDAEVEVDGRRALLRKAGRTLLVQCAGSDTERWVVTPATPPTKREDQNEGYQLLFLTAPKADRVRVEVFWHLLEL